MPTIANSNATTKSEIRALTIGKGLVLVQGSTATTAYQCAANGTTDDRATILSALTAAIADMPAVVTFGPGNYRMAGGIEVKPAQGATGLYIVGAGPNLTKITINKGSALSAGEFVAFAIKPSTYPTTGDYANYLNDIHVTGIGFTDSDPATHAGGGEESHAVHMKYIKDCSVTHCKLDSIGDEGIDFEYCVRLLAQHNHIVNTPAIGSSGSGISVAAGCVGAVIANNVLHGSSTIGTKTTTTLASGISIAVVASAAATDIRDVIVSNNFIADYINGIYIGCADTTNNSNIYGAAITDNAIRNCTSGVLMGGSAGIRYNTNVSSNEIVTISDTAIDFDVSAANNLDCIVAFNNIQTTVDGIVCNGTRLNLSGNSIKDATSRGIYIFTASSVVITGGHLDNCGGTSLPNIIAQSDGFDVTINGVKITNAQSTTSVISNCENILGCIIEQDSPNWAQITSASNVKNCTLNGGIRLDETLGRAIVGNTISTVGYAAITADAIELTAGNDNCIVNANYINTTNTGSTFRYGIDIVAGATNNIVTDNMVITHTPGSGIRDGGTTTTLADNKDI